MKDFSFKILLFLRIFVETKTILLLYYEGLWHSSMSSFVELKCVSVPSDEYLSPYELIIGWIGTRMFHLQTSGRHGWLIDFVAQSYRTAEFVSKIILCSSLHSSLELLDLSVSLVNKCRGKETKFIENYSRSLS